MAGSRELNPSLGGQAGVVVVSCWFFPEQALFSTKIAMVVGARVTTYLARAGAGMFRGGNDLLLETGATVVGA